MNPDHYVTLVSPEEIEEGIAVVLERLGLTFNELRAQARDGSFVSERARLTWFAVGSLAPTS